MSSPEQTSVAEALSELTGRPAEDFDYEGEVPDFPHPGDLERVGPDE